jgi:hypothetical protein
MRGSFRIISGGQTGVDRAALDVAIEMGLEHGGWCPAGRLAEDGRIPAKYKLRELADGDYRMRTEKNVLESDGTLVLFDEAMGAGTTLTVRLARQFGKPWLSWDFACRILSRHQMLEQTLDWICENGILVLNVAGPRRSSNPKLPRKIRPFLRDLFQELAMNPCAPE